MLPGWNVSEPLQLAFKLYEVCEALKSAPDEAKAFILKVQNFRRSLEVLQQALKDDVKDRYSIQSLENLHATLTACQDCVKRCEDFSKRFRDLTGDGKGTLTGAGQRVRLVWQEKKVAKLAAAVDSQISNIALSLAITEWVSPQANDRYAIVKCGSCR